MTAIYIYVFEFTLCKFVLLDTPLTSRIGCVPGFYCELVRLTGDFCNSPTYYLSVSFISFKAAGRVLPRAGRGGGAVGRCAASAIVLYTIQYCILYVLPTFLISLRFT